VRKSDTSKDNTLFSKMDSPFNKMNFRNLSREQFFIYEKRERTVPTWWRQYQSVRQGSSRVVSCSEAACCSGPGAGCKIHLEHLEQQPAKEGKDSTDSEAGVFKKLSLAGLAKLSQLRYSWLRFGLASADYRGLRVHNRLVYTAD